MDRIACIERNTAETQIKLTLNLDGSGNCNVKCRIGFFRHMLSAFCKHGMFDLDGSLEGDLDIDQHHLVEDTGIVLGLAFAKALGDYAGIFRVGSCLYPMDETLCRVAVDFGGRSYLVYETALFGVPLVGMDINGTESLFQTDSFEDFWQGFVGAANCSLHLDTLRGRSDHHKMEAICKAAGRAIRKAVTIDIRRKGSIPSTKGVIV